MKHVILPQAKRDLDEIEDHIAQGSVDAALRMEAAVRETIDTIVLWPESGRRRSTDRSRQNIRSFPIYHYSQYLIFYRVTADEIQVVRVMNGARDIGPILKEML